MKILLPFVFLLCGAQIFFAQTKVDEYEKPDSSLESARILTYLENLRKRDDSLGLIAVYTGDHDDGVKNALMHIDGIKRYLKNYNLIPLERIYFQTKPGKTPLFKEFWVYGKNEPVPNLPPPEINLDNLSKNYLFASVCVACNPVEQTLSSAYVSFALYAELLARYPAYHAEIVINPLAYSGWNSVDGLRDANDAAADYRRTLVNDYQIADGKINITIAKPIGRDTPLTANFYVAPPSRPHARQPMKKRTNRRARR